MPSTNSPTPATLTGLFARSVTRFPRRTAVRDDSTALTYSELDARSDDIASALRARGVGSEDRVGLHLERGVEVFAGILGILKAGAAYVAVDTRYPNARRDLMLRHSGAKVVLTSTVLEAALGPLALDALVLPVGPSGDALPDPGDRARPDGAASVLFTSGSSGSPKAVVLEHRNIVSFAVNPALPALRPEDRTGQISSLSFDAFHFEMWTTLAHGGQVVVLPAVPDLLAAGFRGALERRGITAMLVPTMVVNQVVREDRDAFAPLRILHVGGDVLRPTACAELLSGEFNGDLFNLYGPAETTTACTAHRVTLADTRRDSIPIGRPLDGVTIQLLDPDRWPVASGGTGEIYVGGPGVGRGYLSAPHLTERAFVAGPEPDGPPRLYRTGDLARLREDGALEFLGRADDQVKIRGYRVEPAEVARSLRRHPLVHDAVVVPTGEGEDRHLVAFVVLEQPVPESDLRDFARERLPHYLVPSRVVVLPEIPSSDHGKRDTAALRAFLAAEPDEEPEEHGAPLSGTERYLVDLWKSLLGTEDVGVRDDFFALGGHSLLAFRMQNRIKRELGVALDFRLVLRTPVLADVAALVDAATATGAAR